MFKEIVSNGLEMIAVYCLLVLPFGVLAFLIYLKQNIRKKRYNKYINQHSNTVPVLNYQAKVGLKFELEVVDKLIQNGFCNVFHNVYIPTCKGKVTQIDVLLVHTMGIFVIECKNWDGVIWGDSRWNRWIKISGFKKYGKYGAGKTINLNANEIFSPIRQNDYHVSILKNYFSQMLELSPPIFNVIVFNSSADNLNVNNDSKCLVVSVDDIVSSIKKQIEQLKCVNTVNTKVTQEKTELICSALIRCGTKKA